MDKCAFRSIRRTSDSVRAMLAQPDLAIKIYKHLEYINGGSLPTTGVIAGQAVSSMVDYQLGLRDPSAIAVKDIDHFFPPTWSDVFKSSLGNTHLAQRMATWLIEYTTYEYTQRGAATWGAFLENQHCYPQDISPIQAVSSEQDFIADVFLAVKQYAPSHWRAFITLAEKWYSCAEQTARAVMPLFAQWPHIEHVEVQKACQQAMLRLQADVSTLYDQHAFQYERHATSVPQIGAIKPGVQNNVSCADDVEWDAISEIKGYFHGTTTSAFVRNNIAAGPVHASYAVLGVRDNCNAVQPVMTTSVDLRGNTCKVTLLSVSVEGFNQVGSVFNDILHQFSGMGYAFGVIAGFDINAVQVGIELESMQMVFTEAYVQYLCDRQLLLSHSHSPILTVGRLLSKADQLAAYCNRSRAVRHAAVAMANRYYQLSLPLSQLDPKAETLALQHRFEEVRQDPTLALSVKLRDFQSVLVSKQAGDNLMQYPEIEKDFTLEYIPHRQNSCILVPKHAEPWQYQACELKVENQRRGYDPESTFLKFATDTLQVQVPEANDRWAQRMYAFLSFGPALNKNSQLTTFMSEVYKGLLTWQLTKDQCKLLDSPKLHPTLRDILQHIELLPPGSITEAYVEHVHACHKVLNKKFKQIKKWTSQLEAVREETRAMAVPQFSAHAQDAYSAESIAHSKWFNTAKHYVFSTLQFRSHLDSFDTDRVCHAIHAELAKEIGGQVSLTGNLDKTLDYIKERLCYDSESASAADIDTLFSMFSNGVLECQPLSGFNTPVSGLYGVLQAMQNIRAKGIVEFAFRSLRDDYHRVNALSLLEKCLNIAAKELCHTMKEVILFHRTQLEETYLSLMARPEFRQYTLIDDPINLPDTENIIKDGSCDNWVFKFWYESYLHMVSLYFARELASDAGVQVASVEPLPLADHVANLQKNLPSSIETFECAELLSDVTLAIEGMQQRHCVASYFSEIQRNECRIIAFQIQTKTGSYRATAEWRPSPTGIQCRQLQGAGNTTPHPMVSHIHDALLNSVNRAKTAWPEMLPNQEGELQHEFEPFF